MSHELITTSDGSHSLYVPELNETYHSTHGAIQESQHVFIRAGFESVSESRLIRVLEVGMGTGLNALLTMISAFKAGREIHYTAVEAFPLPVSVTSSLNYASLTGDEHAAEWFDKIHSTVWETDNKLTGAFILHKMKGTVQDVRLDRDYNVVYFDAFAPQKQPEMWTPEVFAKIYGAMSGGGVLVTYCAKGQVKRDLRSVGFEVESLPGPPGKREMIRARRVNRSDTKLV